MAERPYRTDSADGFSNTKGWVAFKIEPQVGQVGKWRCSDWRAIWLFHDTTLLGVGILGSMAERRVLDGFPSRVAYEAVEYIVPEGRVFF